MVRLTDIAKAVDLDVSVVSRALNPNPDRYAVVREETRAMIQNVARKMGYRPNRQASFLKKGGTATILCYLPDTGSDLVAALMTGISEQARRDGFPVSFFFGSSSADFDRFLREAESMGPSGILSYPPQKMPEKIRRGVGGYAARGGKILFLNVTSNTNGADSLPDEFEGIPRLDIDDFYGGGLVARHMLERGCKKFYYHTVDENSYRSRRDGFAASLAEAGFKPEVIRGDDMGFARHGTKRIGIFSEHDILALRAMQGLALSGIVPGDSVLLSGFNDRNFCPWLAPSLTSVHQPMREEGAEALKKLVRMIFGGREGNQTLKPFLVGRESTGCQDTLIIKE